MHTADRERRGHRRSVTQPILDKSFNSMPGPGSEICRIVGLAC